MGKWYILSTSQSFFSIIQYPAEIVNAAEQIFFAAREPLKKSAGQILQIYGIQTSLSRPRERSHLPRKSKMRRVFFSLRGSEPRGTTST